MAQEVTVLLVEDNEVDVEAVRRGFRKQRIANQIRVARDGMEALELLRSKDPPFPRPFLILLDINMPRMNGIELLRALRADETLHSSVVFVLTTSDAEQDMVDAYDLNVAGYMLKGDVGEGFVKLTTMLDHYWRVVLLPPGELRSDDV